MKQNSIDVSPKPFFTIDPDYRYAIGVTFLPLNILIDIDQLGPQSEFHQNPMGFVTERAVVACIQDGWRRESFHGVDVRGVHLGGFCISDPGASIGVG